MKLWMIAYMHTLVVLVRIGKRPLIFFIGVSIGITIGAIL